MVGCDQSQLSCAIQIVCWESVFLLMGVLLGYLIYAVLTDIHKAAVIQHEHKQNLTMLLDVYEYCIFKPYKIVALVR